MEDPPERELNFELIAFLCQCVNALLGGLLMEVTPYPWIFFILATIIGGTISQELAKRR